MPFTVYGIDNAPDLYGDVVDPQLVVFFGGNQFMVLDDLLREFRKAYPAYQRIFVETLPPGVMAKQIEQGAVVVGNLRIDLKPDVYAAGKSRMDMTPEWFTRTTTYAQNRLAIMVRQGNPKQVRGLRDLGRPDVRVSMPNPAWEGIGKRIEESYEKAGGPALKSRQHFPDPDSPPAVAPARARRPCTCSSPLRVLVRPDPTPRRCGTLSATTSSSSWATR
jgi:molybdate transport system substrate-binding protein